MRRRASQPIPLSTDRQPGCLTASASSTRRIGRGVANLFWQSADAVTEAEQLTTGLDSHFAHSISPDGKRLVLRRNRESLATGADLMMLVLDGSKLEELIVTSSAEDNGEISPDGRWLAYQTDRSGRFDDLRASVSGCTRRRMADFEWRWHGAALVA